MDEPDERSPKPFLKWAGGKNWLVPLVGNYLPDTYNRYFEPFLGSATVFFAQRKKDAVLSDINANLIDTYIAIKERPDKVISKLRQMPYEKDYYYLVRDRYKPRSAACKAARFIYLNRTCWNGLYRENRNGAFNVPFGSFRNPTICDAENLLRTSEALQEAKLRSLDFKDALSMAAKGDFVFIDPPYVTRHQNNGFLKYNNRIFSWDDQIELSKMVKKLHKRGCYILMTNANHDSVRSLYQGFKLSFEKRFSSIAANNEFRGTTTELLICNY